MPRGRPRSSGVSGLEQKIQEHAARFAREVIAALRSAPLADIAALAGSGAGGLGNLTVTLPDGRPKRKMLNYPKCRWPGCGKNMSPRTRPYCGEHNRRVKSGEEPPPGARPQDSTAGTASAQRRGKRAPARVGRRKRRA